MKSHADSPSLFDAVDTRYLQEGTKPPQPVALASWRAHKGFILVTVKGVTARDQAEKLRGRDVLLRESDLPELGEGEHYLYQLMGCRVVLEDGTEVGELAGFYETGEQDTWVIVTEAGIGILLPAVPEFVLDIDLDAETILIDPPEGLLDLYLNPEPPRKKKRTPPRRKKQS